MSTAALSAVDNVTALSAVDKCCHTLLLLYKLVRINLSCSSTKTICPTLSSRLTGAPCSKRTLIQSKFPRTAAQCKGVSPSYNQQNKTNRSVYKKCERDRGEGSTSQLQISSLCASSSHTHTPLR